jgi:hypothetical protein
VVEDISHEGLRQLLHQEGVSFQRLKTWKASTDPDYAVKKARVEHLYAIADGEVIAEPGEPEVIFCVDEFGPLNLQPHPGRQWAAVSGKNKEPGRPPRLRRRATCTRTAGVRHLFAACELGEDQLFGHIKPRKTGPVSWSSAATCARSIHPRPAGRYLGVSARTVRRQMAALMERLGAASRFEAGLKAAQHGWLLSTTNCAAQ